MPFVQQFPKEATERLVKYLRGDHTAPINQTVEDCYDILGYGLFLGVGSNRPLIAMGHPVPEGREERAAVLQSAMSQHGVIDPLMWKTVLGIALDLLKELITK